MITSRRVFLGGLSTSMLAVGLGAPLRGRLRWALGLDQDDLEALTFGELEALAALMQEKAPDELQRILIEKIRAGLDLRTLVAAGAMANARTFGGQDYTGYHCMMALMPAYEMSQQLPAALQPLPVLKVLYRNATRIQEMGGRSSEALRALPEAGPATRAESAQRLRTAYLERDLGAAERAFAELTHHGAEDAYNELQTNLLQENLDVHRVVLAWRAWEVMELTGKEHAQTLLRQSVRFCVDAEKERVERGEPSPELRTLLPELLEQVELVRKEPPKRVLSDEELEKLSLQVFCCDPADAARIAAQRLAEGVSHEDVGEAMSLAANALLRHDPGRQRDATREKPLGSVHGASIGVHASDAARAWRNIASVSNPRNAAASLIAGAYHTAGKSAYVGKQPFGYEDCWEHVRTKDKDELLRQTRAAIEEGDQKLACALVQSYCQLGYAERPMFDLMLEYGISADGALHAEKYYRTVCEEYTAARPAFRSRHLVALARVTASEHGFPAPGRAAARERLGV